MKKPKLQTLNHLSIGMNKWFHPTFLSFIHTGVSFNPCQKMGYLIFDSHTHTNIWVSTMRSEQNDQHRQVFPNAPSWRISILARILRHFVYGSQIQRWFGYWLGAWITVVQKLWRHMVSLRTRMLKGGHLPHLLRRMTPNTHTCTHSIIAKLVLKTI